MAQKLIVEGNDAIVLARLCQMRGLPSPLGYETKEKFKEEFVAVANGYAKTLRILELAIQQPDLTNIGIIVDADDAGALARWQAIRAVLVKKYETATLEQADTQMGPKVITEENRPTIGVWIMPDNARNGYLEFFLADLVPPTDALWNYARQEVADLQTKPFCELTPAKIGKAFNARDSFGKVGQRLRN